jgi:Tfp pilus assembly protein PilV
MRIRHNHQFGDTIVEVLIAITVISFILTGAYLVANVNVRAERQSEERSEALELLQSQLEEVRADIASSSLRLSLNNNFCMISNSPQTSNCYFNAAGNQVSSTASPAYNVTISWQPPIPSGLQAYNLTITASWAQVGGGTENTVLFYRAYST